VNLRVSGGLADLDAGRPLRADGCGKVALAGGATALTGVPADFVVDDLRLLSDPPLAVVPASSTGRVISQGDAGRGKRSGVVIAAGGPSWLILGESFNRGWRAVCNGKDLGPPRPMQGYANGWPITGDCQTVDFTWSPNRLLPIAYVISLVGCLVLLGVLLLRRRRGPAAAVADVEPEPLPGWTVPERWPLGRALAAGVVLGAAFGFVFALRAGAVFGPALALILWRGIGGRTLVLAAGALLLVGVPLAYAIAPEDDDGGYGTTYAVDHVAGHWVAVGAVGLLLIALVRLLAVARRRDGLRE
jgi:hypothetical protein